ncbi:MULTISPECIES: DNA-3-methyladenine glycosylase [unclassified Rhodococcus (in: high G+C Gram-positive bacteria)]|uniref:DNA-3-methyladenine glycosylase n=1 Tax=unclassified Rhodococcus (in: high G+C Gram-positive bacteria) TaxID=192944 RepID=UPI00146B9498|nr:MULTISPECIES: DNA-3-methyladenine glycosylase [unclassified Rhodococcus (in: high G+C Gram-positive bacteria)]MBF0661267.1 DNA-3-methyladenine glycosylase [Rhodococcus sp. (in: high G+C Gram-positive bacteria)]NMD97704.1 DNA-3-methyladenine glycosylase [Rhodococcus sp. BL-253-APC-6A1W]NME80673.1 DNA-3-methyladenine glycosylase [Rhodococcus sp. 105337]
MSAQYLESLDPVEAARALLGAVVRVGDVAIRLTEVEAYGGPEDGPWPDPSAHSYRGPSARNAVMFGPAGHLYVYRSYGLHLCANISVGPDGVAAAVLLRGGEIVDGEQCASRRRTPGMPSDKLARGPGNLAAALGLDISDNGLDVFSPRSRVRLELPERRDDVDVASGPRVGISVAADRPWRLWIPGSPGVSAYRRSPRAPALRTRMG